jgi:hypothetical protein
VLEAVLAEVPPHKKVELFQGNSHRGQSAEAAWISSPWPDS